MPDLQSRHRDSLAFLAPGLVHRLGNVLFTIQGHAELGRDSEAQLATIRGAAERGNRAITVMQTLLGQSGHPAVSAAELLQEIADLLRISVRERDHTIEVALADGAGAVDPGTFCPAVLECVRLVLAAVPPGQGGEIRLELGGGPAEIAIRVTHTAAAGDLPFPLPLQQIGRELHKLLPPGPARPAVTLGKSMMELSFGPNGRGADATAQA